MAQFKLVIVTPEKEIYSDNIDAVNVPSSEGQLGILSNHSSLMAKLVPGELNIKKGGSVTTMATGGGFLQVHKNVATIMTDLAVDEKEIDEKAVDEAKKRAEQALDQKLSDEEYAETLAILEKSLAQLKVKRRHRTR